MSIFVTLYKFADEGIRNVKDSPGRIELCLDLPSREQLSVGIEEVDCDK